MTLRVGKDILNKTHNFDYIKRKIYVYQRHNNKPYPEKKYFCHT